KKIDGVGEKKLQVERVTTDGSEIFEVPLPAVITVSNEIGQPRIPTGWGIIAAAKKKILSWSARDLGIDLSGIDLPSLRITKLFIPARDRKCQIIMGETPAEAAVNLAMALRKAKVI
ncbi:MAG: electron transfer flavoprotein subunit beta/FixA family protein, partial [Chloroflexi bacterium]